MDKIQKSLEKLSTKEKSLVKEILNKLVNYQFVGLNIQKLQGHKDIYRLRKGNLKIIYRQTEKDIFILAMERRSEKTYKRF
jgi:mRNA-degrading endonuclease RelE of RelBE toxin-antitoxin system